MFLAPVSLDLNGQTWSFWLNPKGDLMVREPSGRESPEHVRPEIKLLAREVVGFDVASLPAVGNGPETETEVLVVYADRSGKLGQARFRGADGWGGSEPPYLCLSEMEVGARCPSLARQGERIWLTYAADPPDGGWCLWQRSFEEGEWSQAVAIDFGSEGTVDAGLVTVDGQGVAHLFYLWLGPDSCSRLLYRYRYPIMLDWSEASAFVQADSAIGLPASCLDPTGNLLLAWPVEEGEGVQIRFARHLSGGWPGGGWEEARLVAPTISWASESSEAGNSSDDGSSAGRAALGPRRWLALKAGPGMVFVHLLMDGKVRSFCSLDGGKAWRETEELTVGGQVNPVRIYTFRPLGDAKLFGLEETRFQGAAIVEAPVEPSVEVPAIGQEAIPEAQAGDTTETPSQERVEGTPVKARLQLTQPLRTQGTGIQLVPAGGRFPAMRWPQVRAGAGSPGGAAGQERLGRDLAEMEDYLKRLRQYIRELEERNVRLEGTIMEKNRRLSLVADASRQYIARAQALTDELKEKQRLAESLQSELQAFQKEVQASQTELARIQREKEALEQQNRRLAAEMDHLRQVIEQLRREMDTKTQEISQLKEKLAELELRNQELKNALAEKRARFWERLKRQF